ncbi:Rna pseudouridine synthase superfamily protein [Cardiosporidium cionae]|uniref:Rna pseudouridine synthase superfamily protein n=1 Tax=Cardiosporidium cionae TaxID=476202 RepID=A0ABQ7J521_9APIC|nr:Rna pseudouridine synthase superfamily protein [Cardiosporidium cionae]|eukprot:KAF8819088.1 Rna pseudouridine synthase superfamily protein [Cardiosporidium cionae]
MLTAHHIMPSSTVIKDNFVHAKNVHGRTYICIPPYWTTYRVHAKERWCNKQLLQIFLSNFRSRSEGYWTKAIEAGAVKVNNSHCTPDTTIRNGDVVTHLSYNIEFAGREDPIKIIFEDKNILVAQKPAGIPCHPQGRYQKLSLTYQIKEFHLKDQNAYLHPLNRLDRVTGGIVILAKSKESSRKFSSQVSKAKKIYLAKVYGQFPTADALQKKLSGDKNSLSIGKSSIDDWLICRVKLCVLKENVGEPLMVEPSNSSGKASETWFKTLDFDGENSLIMARPITGRTHQIRAHLQALGYPIVNDRLYSKMSGRVNVLSGLREFQDIANEIIVKFPIDEIIPPMQKGFLNSELDSTKFIQGSDTILPSCISKIYEEDFWFSKSEQMLSVCYNIEDPQEICLLAYQYNFDIHYGVPSADQASKKRSRFDNTIQEYNSESSEIHDPLCTNIQNFVCRELPEWLHPFEENVQRNVADLINSISL